MLASRASTDQKSVANFALGSSGPFCRDAWHIGAASEGISRSTEAMEGSYKTPVIENLALMDVPALDSHQDVDHFILYHQV
jgi:hypothetical protein